MAKSSEKTKRPRKRSPVSLPPPPNACDLGDYCDKIKANTDTISNAPSGSIFYSKDGVLVAISPPNPLTADMIPVLDHTTGQWTLVTR